MTTKVPVSWLREYLKTDIAAKTIANYLSLSGPSVEKIIKRKGDYIFDVEVTSNRPDAFSVYGLAREAHAIISNEGQKSLLAKPKGLDLILEPDTSSFLPLEVIIKDKSLCPRFTAIVLANVKIKPSPAIIKNRLEASGIRSINNIVDISNYLMLELGQPMHTFDYDKIKGGKMILREAREGEKITTLDKKTRKLPRGAIVIEDERRLIDLCGIMGGENSQITKRTRRIVIFVQAYDSKAIRKTVQALSFRTEAASRFEKGVDTETVQQALARAVYLVKKTAGGKIASELIDIYLKRPKFKQIELKLSKLNQYLGIEFESPKAAKILDLLGFSVKVDEQKLIAKQPSWRIADIKDDVDLIEEIARIYGYWRLPSELPSGQSAKVENSDLEKVIGLKTALKYLGLTEVISYSIISKEFLDLSGLDPKKYVELANPLTDQWQFMRPTILVSLASVIAKNQNVSKNLKIFEIAKIYLKQENDLPRQDLMLSIAFQNGDFYQIKGLVENILEITSHVAKWQKLTRHIPLFKKDQSASLSIGKENIGTVGILNWKICEHFDIEEPLAAAELNLTKIYGLSSIIHTYKQIPKYPPVIEDISAIFDVQTPLAQISQETQKAGSPLVKNVEVVDVFEDEQIGKGKKSVTVRLTYQRQDRTSSQDEVSKTRQKIIDSLIGSFQAIIRR